jgi:hypothetical protein
MLPSKSISLSAIFFNVVSRGIAAIGHYLLRFFPQALFHTIHRRQQLRAVVGFLRHGYTHD